MKHQAVALFHANDATGLRELLRSHPELTSLLKDPVDEFGGPPILHVKSTEMLDVLLDAGADINARSDWKPGGFTLLEQASPEIAAYAITRGATLTAHAASRLGMLQELAELLRKEPNLVSSRGGDGQTPLHFAKSIEVAELLLGSGADVDARDLDHESTPAQWMLDGRTEVARYLIERGCKTDILMAAALGDVALVDKHLLQDPDSIRMRVSDEWFPMVGRGSGGTIYQWTLGWYVSAVQVAKAKGFQSLSSKLMQQCPVEEKLLNACWLHDAATAKSVKVEEWSASGRRHLAHACRNNDMKAAQLLLEAGCPVDGTSQHRGTALHWAAWHGNLELVRLLLASGAALDGVSNDFRATPLGWARHGKDNGWHRATGDYPATIEALEAAGAG